MIKRLCKDKVFECLEQISNDIEDLQEDHFFFRKGAFNTAIEGLTNFNTIITLYENKDRYLTDEQFARYAAGSVSALRVHPKYGEYVNKILKKVGAGKITETPIYSMWTSYREKTCYPVAFRDRVPAPEIQPLTDALEANSSDIGNGPHFEEAGNYGSSEDEKR
mgnify:CR=1 FL=1